HAELHVCAIVLVRENLSHVVQERPALGELHIELELRRDDPREPGDLLRMLEDILPVGRAVAHPADELHELGVHSLDARLVDRLFARLDDRGVDLPAPRAAARPPPPPPPPPPLRGGGGGGAGGWGRRGGGAGPPPRAPSRKKI